MHEEAEECANIPGAERSRRKPRGANGVDEPEHRLISVTATVAIVPPSNPFEPEDISDFLAVTPPPRQWLLGTVACRTFLTVLAASGGSGKSSVVINWAIALTTKHAIAGFHIHKRARVLVLTFEDTADEYRRRFAAAFKHHDINPKDATGHLYVRSLNGIGATIGSVHHSRTDGPMVLATSAPALIEDVVARLNIDVVTFDPFVKCSGVPENDNVAVDAVVKILAGICERRNVACVVLHHNRKGQSDPGNMEMSRGASSLIDGARIGLTLTPMSKEEAELYQVPEEERRRLIRLDDGKVNLSLKADPTWYRLASINIGNGTDDYPRGDNVQAVETWQPPDMWGDLPPSLCCQIIDEIDAGMPDGERFSNHNRATDRAAWKIVTKHQPELAEKPAKKVISTWLKNGVLFEENYDSKKERKPVVGLFANPTKRPGKTSA